MEGFDLVYYTIASKASKYNYFWYKIWYINKKFVIYIFKQLNFEFFDIKINS